MKEINSIDLWTEQGTNHIDCFCGAFIDGFDGDNIPFDSYKVVKNCNCVIYTNDPKININNKHNAIVFYRSGEPVRLVVINRGTDVDKCIDTALAQPFNGGLLRDIYQAYGITRRDVNMNEPPIINSNGTNAEIDSGSCDRISLLGCMLEGSYTESDTNFGKDNPNSDFEYLPNLGVIYILKTDEECFAIQHSTAFINKDKTRVIPLQTDSRLDIIRIAYDFMSDVDIVNSKIK